MFVYWKAIRAVYEPVCISNLHENLIHKIIHLDQPLELSTKHKTINILSYFLSKTAFVCASHISEVLSFRCMPCSSISVPWTNTALKAAFE